MSKERANLSKFTNSLCISTLFLGSLGEHSVAPKNFPIDNLTNSNIVRITVGDAGVESNNNSYVPFISSNGRFVVFSSDANNLVENDINSALDVFLYDSILKNIELVSIGSNGQQGNSASDLASVSDNGQLILFRSYSNNLHDNLVPGSVNIFLRDRVSLLTKPLIIDSENNVYPGDYPILSRDGNKIGFVGWLGISGDHTNNYQQVFLRDRSLQSFYLVSSSSNNEPSNFYAFGTYGKPYISQDGRFTTFSSSSNNLVENDTNSSTDVFLKDSLTGLINLISNSQDGSPGNGNSYDSIISSNGRYVIFTSFAKNLIIGFNDTNPGRSVYGYDTIKNEIFLISKSNSNEISNNDSHGEAISADGRFIVYTSEANNLVTPEVKKSNIYIYDRILDSVVNFNPTCSNRQLTGQTGDVSISGDGRFLAFVSNDSHIVSDDNNNSSDIFVYDMFGIKRCIFNSLRLPLHSESSFYSASQGNINGLGPGRVNSWFDHQFPTYNSTPNNLFPGLLRWDGRLFPEPTKIGEGWYDGHNGIDFKIKFPGEKTYPSALGEVFGTVNNCALGDKSCGGGFGNQVWIDHKNGYATLYAHLENTNVTNGQQITNLDIPLGTIGSTGNSTGTHLHFGVYFDKNQDGRWVPNEVVDPYGWQADFQDPWGIQSAYLWRENLWNTQILDSSGGILNSPSGNITINFPPGSISNESTWEIWENSASLASFGKLRNLGSSFWLRYLNWPIEPLINSQNTVETEPVTIAARYTDEQIKHLNELQITINKLNAEENSWTQLETQVDTDLNQVMAQTNPDEAQFDLQAPLLCPEDSTEPNDSYYAAQSLNLNEQKTGILDISDDQDWYQIILEQGQNYEVIASPLNLGSKTSIEVYDIDGTTLLAAIDNGVPISTSVSLSAPRTGGFYIKIENENGSYGCNVKYELIVNRVQNSKIFLPLVTK